MSKKYHTFLLVFALSLFLGAGYIYFADGSSSEAATTTSGGLASSSGSQTLGGTINNKIALDTAFLVSLISLKTITIDTTLLALPAFRALRDNTVKLEEANPGRSNPFSPIDALGNTANTTTVPVVTNVPTQVTTKTAVFNGVLNTSSTVTSSYFEYGATPSLGKSTASATQSLVGTFVTKVNGLTPATTYFYRAAAKINGTIVYGEIVSFNTN